MSYKAKESLYIGFVKARNEGDVVSDEDVKKYGWDNQVEKVAEKKADSGPAKPAEPAK